MCTLTQQTHLVMKRRDGGRGSKTDKSENSEETAPSVAHCSGLGHHAALQPCSRCSLAVVAVMQHCSLAAIAIMQRCTVMQRCSLVAIAQSCSCCYCAAFGFQNLPWIRFGLDTIKPTLQPQSLVLLPRESLFNPCELSVDTGANC